MGVRLLFVTVVAALLVACAPENSVPTVSALPSATTRAATATVTCGPSDLPNLTYDASAQACVWDAYSTGTPLRWSATMYTTEGAAVPETLHFEGGVLVVTRDMTADGFTNPVDRRVWSWRCTAMTKRPFVTDPQRYAFELTGCMGEFASPNFP